MPSLVRKLSAAATAVAMIAVPTGSIASAPASVASQAAVQQANAAASTNPWLTLSAMTGSSSSASAAAAAAAQGEAGPDFPPIAPLVVILGTIALGVWILLKDDKGQRANRGDPDDPDVGNASNVLDDFVNVLVPTPQIPISPA